MNFLTRFFNNRNKIAPAIPSTIYQTTKVVIHNDTVKLISPHIRQIFQATELVFGSKHRYLWIGMSDTSATTYTWFLPEVQYMLSLLMDRKLADPVYATQLLLDTINLDTWVGRTRASPRIDYKQINRVLKWKPLPHQLKYMEHFEYSTTKYELKGGLVAMAAGLGKALPLDEPVLTPKGWVRNGVLRVGEHVIDSQGRPTEVLGVYPQGIKECYRIKFIDDTAVECSGDHLWAVSSNDGSNKKVISTLEIYETDMQYSIPLAESWKTTGVTLPIDPYLLGTSLTLANIPTLYLNAGLDQRKALYDGFMSVTVGDYSTISEELSEDFCELARGLGKVVVRQHKDGVWVISELDVRHKQITSITKIDDAPTQCISVASSDHLYITNGYNLTHNTYTSIAIGEGLQVERIIVLCPKAAVFDPWVESTKDLYRKPVSKVWSVLDGGVPRTDDRYIIINYAYIDKLYDIMRPFRMRNTLIIVDESHNLNEVSAAQTKSYMRLARTYGDTILHLSGTPLKATTTELLPILSVIDDRFTEDVVDLFTKVFGRTNNQDVIGMIQNRLHQMAYVVEKSVLKLKRPIVRTHIITFKNSDRFTLSSVKRDMEIYAEKRLKLHMKNRPKAVLLYNKLVHSVDHPVLDDFTRFENYIVAVMNTTGYMHVRDEMKYISQYENNIILPALSTTDRKRFRKIRAIAKYPKLKVLGETLGNVLGKARIQCNIELAKHINYKKVMGGNKGKTLLFSNHVDAVNMVATTVKHQGYQPLVMYGDHIDDLPEIVRTFRDNPDANPLGATYASLATAVPLTMVSDVVILDAPFRDYVLTQAIARAHRLGNDKQVYVHYIMLKTNEPNVNDRSLDLAEWSGETVADILGIEPTVDYPVSINAVAEE